MSKRITPEQQNSIIKKELIEIIKEAGKVPVKIYYARNKGESHLFKTLESVSEFLGYSRSHIEKCNFWKKNNVAPGKLFFKVTDIKKQLETVISDLDGLYFPKVKG